MALLVILLTVFLAGTPGDRSNHFDQLKLRALAMDEGTDFMALREAYTDVPSYDPLFSISDEYRQAFSLVADGDRQAVLSVCGNTTASFVVSIEFHRLCASRLTHLDVPEESRVHEFLAKGLLASLKPNDRGEILIVELEEQYSYVAWHGYKVVGHATVAPVDRDGPTLSALEVVDQQGNERRIYFRKHPAYDRFQEKLIEEALDALAE